MSDINPQIIVFYEQGESMFHILLEINPHIMEESMGKWLKAMINDLFVPKSGNVNINELWFQQHGPIRHIANKTIQLLKIMFD